MNILLLANYKRGANLGFHACRALSQLGHTVTLATPLPCGEPGALIVPEDVDAVSLVNSLAVKPDLLLWAETSVGNRFLPRRILEVDIPTACWLGDNYLNHRWHKEYCALYDYAFYAQLGRMELAQKIHGYSHLHWLPWGADEEFHRDFHLERDIDVGYVGTIIKDKVRFFQRMEEGGIPVAFNKTFLVGDSAVGEYYSRCKIVYNICARFDVNPRTFEACCAGALLVHQRVIDKGFYRIFTPGENCDVHDFDDAPDIIRKWLANPVARGRAAAAGQKLVLEKHLYRHRMQELLDVVKGGVTERRRAEARGYHGHLRQALTFQHPHFRLKVDAARGFKMAFAANFFGSAFYLLKYAFWRVVEKLEKIRWEMGKRPV